MSQRGMLRKRGDTWTAYWYVRQPDGSLRQRSKGGFRTQREARAHLTATITDLATGRYVEPRRITLGQYLTDEWLPTLQGTRRPSTVASYTDVINGVVIPRLGGTMLAALSPRDVQGFVDELAKNGRRRDGGPLGARSIGYALVVLGAAMNHAVKLGLVPRNPVAAIDRPRAPRVEMTCWSASEAARFLAHVRDDRLHPLFLLALTRGLRRGELAGLRWCDVDLDAGRLSIVQARVSVGGRVVVSEPKTARGRRTIPLDVDLTRVLREHRRGQVAERLAWGEGWIDSGYVFTRENGTPLHPEAISGAFDRHVRAAGLPRIRFHDCRHTAATLSLAAGISADVVSRWLGHGSISMTVDTYRHAIPSMQEEAGAFLTRLILDADQGEAR